MSPYCDCENCIHYLVCKEHKDLACGDEYNAIDDGLGHCDFYQKLNEFKK